MNTQNKALRVVVKMLDGTYSIRLLSISAIINGAIPLDIVFPDGVFAEFEKQLRNGNLYYRQIMNNE